jgi:hypothetical protein
MKKVIVILLWAACSLYSQESGLYRKVYHLNGSDTGVSQKAQIQQTADSQAVIYRKPYNLSGPRIGVSYLSQDFINTVKRRHNITLTPLVAQFGWQFEQRFFSLRDGFTAVTEWIPLVGGFEQEKFLPSLSWMVGARTRDGFEFGAGPNVSLSGTAVVIAAGVTMGSGQVNFPINLAVVLSKSGPRFGLILGFNIKDE